MAIVGMGCRFPGSADTPARFWNLLVRGGDAITEIPPDRPQLVSLYDPDPARPGAVYSRWGGFVDGIDRFDAAFFGISPREARRIDPQQRLLLEVAWEALEDAGLPADRLAGTATGVFVGISGHDYADLQSRPEQRALIDVHVNAGSATSIAANRISYLLDLRGPSVAVDTACSSALTALHLACASLAAGECELAVVGAVNALLTPEPSIGFCKAGMLSPTGRCRPFDARADGYVRSEGAGAVVLKRLDRAVAGGDPVWAVVLATGVNQDGRTPGISVPNPDAQQALMEAVVADAGLTAPGVQYVEAHGTGTPVGDPREARAIGAAMAGGPCLVGSVKGNVGHLEAAAGMVGLVKAALALRHRQVPPTVHFTEPHPDIPIAGLGLRVPTALEPWPDTGGGPAVAAVNSFGFGGANAHAVLAEPPPTTAGVRPAPAGPHLLTLSARSPAALRDLAGAWARHLDMSSAPLGDLCWTAAARRSHHEHRLAVAGTTAADLRAPLAAYAAGDPAPAGLVAGRAAGAPARTAFVFSGMGPLAWGVARELAGREPVVAGVLDECDRHVRPLAGWSLLDQLHGDRDASFVTEPRAAHVANLAVQLALVALWRSWGVEPGAVAGHSSGEIAAACTAGVIDLAGAVHLAFHRGRLQQRKEGRGGMLAAAIGPGEVAGLVGGDGDRVTVAAVNGPVSVTLSGDLDVLTRVAGELDRRGRFRRLLAVGVPHHSAELDDLRDEVLDAAAAVPARPPAIPMVSTVSGDWLDGAPVDADHWWANMRRPVQFASAVDRLLAAGCDRFVEVGPHPVLAPAVRECTAAAGRAVTVVASLRRGEPERVAMLRALGALHVVGVEPDWAAVFGGAGTCVALPAYPWQRERYWFDAGPAPVVAAAAEEAAVAAGHPLLGRRLATARPAWEADLGAPRLGFLDGHRVQGRVAFPAAGYVETVLAAARAMSGGGPVAVERLRFHRLLAGQRSGVALQVLAGTGDGDGLEVHSSQKGDEVGWMLRASARSAPPPAGSALALDIGALQERCRATDVDALYRSLATAGLQYEGAFRSLTGLWQGDGEALGRVEPPPALDDGDGGGWCVHPAVLDAAFQAAAGLAGELGGSGVVLPVSIGRVAWYGPAGGPVWSHAVVTSRAGPATEVDVTVVDEHGEAVVRCERLRVQRVGGAEAADPAGWRYEERWETAPRPSAPPAAQALAATVQPGVAATAARLGLPDYYDRVAPALDALAVHHARLALEALGLDPAAGGGQPVDQMAGPAGVPARHHRYLARLLAMVAGAPPSPGPPPDPAALAARYPACRSMVELMRESGERLVATLRGDDDARQWMVAGPWLDTLTELYGENPGFRVYAETAADVVAAYRAARGGGPLRVLEVGAGTGGATGPVLDRLPAGAAEYLATDVSPFFTKLLRRQVGHRPGLRTAVLDIEHPPIDGGPFDVVVAAGVVHATADVRRTLATLREAMAPGGLLVLVEAQGRVPWLDLLFGQFEGWWRHADGGLRPDHPLLDVPTWLDVLRAEGFAAAAVTDAGDPAGTGPLQAVLVGTLPPPAAPRRRLRRWLVLTDRRGAGPELAAGLREAGHTCVLAWPGPAYRRFGADGAELAPADAGGWGRLLADAGPFDAVVHLWALDAPDEPGAGGPVQFQATTCGSVVALAAATHGGPAPELWLVTAGAQPAGGNGGDGPGLAQSPLWGLGRVARSEWGVGRCRLVDLGPGAPDADVAALLDELLAAPDSGAAGGGDGELGFRDGRRLARRLDRPAEATAATPRERTVDRSPATASFRLVARRPGALDSLVLQETAPAEPGPGQVAVRVRSGALNFRDVLVALGLGFAAGGGDPSNVPLGWECAGVVESCGEGVTAHRPGDEVLVVAPGSLGARVVVPAGYAVALPAGLSAGEAATLPVAFLTAHCALVRQARLAPGERVLIHSASGGVGLAAVQVARQAGAEVLATAGTPEKRDYVRSLGIECVADSRTLDFVADVLAHTGGEGVDVVLNSLAGEAAARSLDLLRPYGRFVEIGKRDIYEDGRLDLAPFRRNLSYQALDLQPMYDHQPELLAELLAVLRAGVEEGRLQPLPHHQFDLAEAEQAFRFMAQARHIGKVVLTVGEPSYPVVPVAAPRFRPDRTYLVTGGLGGFGLAVAGWMVAEGAGHLVLVSRSGRPRPEDQPAFEALLAAGASVEVRRGDVADQGDVDRVLTEVRATMPALAGIVHAAMVLDDGLLGTLDWPRVGAVLRPKVAGAWNLHVATTAAGDDLDLFVLFSSISAAIGQPGQANYAAANAYLDALATHRRSLGLPALSVAWGVIAGAGYVARRPDLERRMARHGLLGMPVDDACAALGRLLDDGTTRAVVSRGRWGAGTTDDPTHPPASQPAAAAGPAADGAGIRHRLATGPAAARAAAVERYLAETAARVLEATGAVDPDRRLYELGFDSLMAVELTTTVRSDLGVELPIVDLLDGLTVRSLGQRVLERLDSGG